MKKESLALFFSFMAILISVVSICVACPRNQELGFDYQGVLVGVLSLLVTVLVGWNIYTIIDIKNTKDKIDEAIRKIPTGIKSVTDISIRDFE